MSKKVKNKNEYGVMKIIRAACVQVSKHELHRHSPVGRSAPHDFVRN